MTFEQFMKILKKNNVRFTVSFRSIEIDNDIVADKSGNAFIKPAKGIPRFHTDGGAPKDLKDVKEADLKPMIAYYRKLHKYDPLDIVDRIQIFGTDLRYVSANGVTYSAAISATGTLKALKRDLKKGIEELKSHGLT